jgi:hypothetical protein
MIDQLRPEDHTVRVVVRNIGEKPMQLMLRPWGQHYDVEVGQSYEVRARGPATGTLTLEHAVEGVIVRGWSGCILSVHIMKRLGVPHVAELACAAAPTIALRQELYADEDDDDGLV